MEKTPHGPFIAKNILDRTLRVAEGFHSQTSFTKGPISSKEVSELDQSSQTSNQLRVDENFTMHLLSQKKKGKPLLSLGPKSKIVLNIGDGGFNTVLDSYAKAKAFNQSVMDCYGTDVQEGNPAQLDHPKGKVEHSNLMAYSDPNKSYAQGATLSTFSRQHLAKGNERSLLEKRILSLQPNEPQVLRIADDVTML